MKKILFIGSAIVISKVVFLFIPYLINEIQYNAFNKIYYSAAIVILIAKLGFEFAINRIEISHKKLFLAVLFNTIVVTSVVTFLSKENHNVANYSAIFIYSFFYILANIFLIKNLFEGAYQKYFIYKVFYGLILILSIFILLKLSSNVFLIFPVVGFLWFIFIYSFNYSSNKGSGELKDFYKLGIAGFIINAALGFAFISDKYIVNHFFELDTANAYTFGWALTSPILYIGNMIEHSIFATGNENKRKTVFNSALLNFTLVLLYSVFIYFIIKFYPALVPKSINYQVLESILLLFLVVYPLYAIVQAPLNGVLFKFINSSTQFKLAKIYSSLLLIFCLLLFWFFIIHSNKNYALLVILNAGYLFVLLALKAFIVKKNIVNVK